MAVSQLPKFQTLEDIYEMVRTAVTLKRPIRRRLPWPTSATVSASIGLEQGRAAAYALLSVWRREPKRPGGAGLAGELALHCFGNAQPGGITRRPMEDCAKSLPSTVLCCAKVDVDAEAQPDRRPQNGQ